MKNAGQNFLYLCKISSTKIELESDCNFLNEKGRPEIPSNFPQRNSIWNQIETFWMKNAGQSFLYLCKISSTNFDLESKHNFLNEKGRPKFLQTFLNEIRFRIKLKHSEWKTQARISYIFAKCPQQNSIWNQTETFWIKIAGQNFLYLCKIYSTKFDLESNCNFLDGKRRPEVPISLQNFLNAIRFRIKLKHFEWKTQAKISYIFAKFPQRNSN